MISQDLEKKFLEKYPNYETIEDHNNNITYFYNFDETEMSKIFRVHSGYYGTSSWYVCYEAYSDHFPFVMVFSLQDIENVKCSKYLSVANLQNVIKEQAKVINRLYSQLNP